MIMITHEEARNTMMKIETNDAYYGHLQEEHKLMATYISQQEQLQSEHETLKRDVARYLELGKKNFFLTDVWPVEELKEYYKLKEKLSKVGNE